MAHGLYHHVSLQNLKVWSYASYQDINTVLIMNDELLCLSQILKISISQHCSRVCKKLHNTGHQDKILTTN